MPPRKSHAKAKEVNEDGITVKRQHAPEIQWAKNPDWTYSLINYLTDHVVFHLKMFSDSTADAVKENRSKFTARDGKVQQYSVLANHIFPAGQSALYLQNPGRYTTAVETHLQS
jgi:hypothetical protein